MILLILIKVLADGDTVTFTCNNDQKGCFELAPGTAVSKNITGLMKNQIYMKLQVLNLTQIMQIIGMVPWSGLTLRSEPDKETSPFYIGNRDNHLPGFTVRFSFPGPCPGDGMLHNGRCLP